MFSERKWKYLLAVLVFCASSIYAESPTVFSMPDSALLFGTYDEVWVARPGRTEAIKPPEEVRANHGYFAYPSISRRGDLIAWGFARELGKDEHPKRRTRYSLGIYSLAEQRWKTYGDFDDIGTSAFSPDGFQIAFVTQRQSKQKLLIFNVADGTMKSVSHPVMAVRTSLSWSPDAKRLVLNMMQPSKENQFVAVLDLATGNVLSLGEGLAPAWSPSGEWIAYFDPAGANCLIVHPDGTGTKIVKKLRQSLFSYRRFGWGGPVWSPDGKQMLVSEMKGDGSTLDVVLLDVESSRTATKLRNGFAIFGWATRHGEGGS